MHKSAYQHYREEDRHECTLLSWRTNALLWSQSFFIAAWAALQNTRHPEDLKFIMVLIAVLAIIICLLSSIAIYQSCKILKRWHLHGRRLIDEDRQSRPPELMDLHLDRHAPDIAHFLSIDLFGLGLCVVFSVFWICTIAFTLATY